MAEYSSARQLIAYLAMDDEVSLSELLPLAIADGKRVFVPLADESWRLRFLRWRAEDGTDVATYGRWSPSSDEQPQALPTVSLVPARVLDRRGYRVGRGKGCYDRSMGFLKDLGTTVAVAYACQLVDAVPRESHDRSVDTVVTEQGIIRLSSVDTDERA